MLRKFSHSLTISFVGIIVMMLSMVVCIHQKRDIDTIQFSSSTQYGLSDDDANNKSEAIKLLSDKSLQAGLSGSSPQVPHTAPAKRVVTFSFGHPHFFKDAAWLYSSFYAPLQRNFSIIIHHYIPYNLSRACDYYVFALRRILI